MCIRTIGPGLIRATRLAVLGCGLWLALGWPGHARAAETPRVATPKVSPAQWKLMQQQAFERSEVILARAQKRGNLLAQYLVMAQAHDADPSPAFRVIFSQYLAWYQTYIGDYVAARQSYSISQLPERNDAPSPLADPRFERRGAVEAIAALAHGRQLVLFNEAHNIPLTRTLTVQLLQRLREDGYSHFAAETLYESDHALQARGYPTRDSGFYVDEPIYAEMIRSAIALGFVIVAYDDTGDAHGDARERLQAKHLHERVFRRDPHARLIVNAGYAHIQEDGKYLDGKSMAYHLRTLTGIDPLTIEQTMLMEHDLPAHDHPYFRALFAGNGRQREPVVYVGKGGKAWSLKPGWYDVSVFFPPDTLDRGRPTWLDLGGLRQRREVSPDLCEQRLPCLVEARYANERDDAVAADRVLITGNARPGDVPTSTFRVLYLRPGRYRLSARSADERVQHDTITVTARR